MKFQMNDINCDFLTSEPRLQVLVLYISHPSLLIKQDTSLRIFAESSLFVCIFVASFPSLEFFTHMETTSSPVQGCEFWPMLGTNDHWAVRPLACHTCCDTGHPFFMVISENPWHSHLSQAFGQRSCHYLFWRLSSVAAWIRSLSLLHARQTIFSAAPLYRLFALISALKYNTTLNVGKIK